MTEQTPGPPGTRRPLRSDRLHTVAAGLIAVLAVLGGVLLVNVLSSPSGADRSAVRGASASSSAPAATAEPSTATPAGAEPTPKARETRASTPPPSASKPPPSRPPTTKPAPKPSPVFAPVIIYNHSRIQGQAQAAVERVEAAGFRVDRIGSYQGTYNTPVSTVYYDPEHEAAARTMLERVPGVERMVPRSKTNIRRTGTLILVVTKDFPTDLTEG
jgi:hypothetical protein